jgi:hypothetical protein
MDAEALAHLIDRAAARVEQELASSPTAAVEAGPRYGAWLEAAAVRGAFVPAELRPLEDDGGVDDLLTHSLASVLPSGGRGWTLVETVRVETLRQLRETGQLALVIARNPAPADDRVGSALQRQVAGTAPALASVDDIGEAVATHQACEWLRGAGLPGLPDANALRQRVDWLTLLDPFRHLVGDFFRGRRRELEVVRNYVGVLPPGSLRGTATRIVERVFNLHEKPPLLVFGPGGVGKSTLVARFILEHTQAIEEDRFPFAYLDFDRPDVDASEPLTLLAEGVRQLAIAYPHAYEAAEQIRRGWLELLRRGKPPQRARAAAVRDFGILIERLEAADRPVLLVLDTFEQVQSRSEEWVEEIWQFLEKLQAEVPRLRVCIAGRGQIRGHALQELELRELDSEAVVGYLQARGITDAKLAERIARQFGGSPLTLKLVADLAAREGPAALDVGQRRFFGLRASREVVQGQLYARILGHIPDPKVRRLAHPGLVLRRLTPELILEVLAEPCGLAIGSLAEAQVLFGKLAQEVSLVTLDRDGSLVHRSDLRRVMLQLLVADEPEKTRTIHARAIDYYVGRPPLPRERAEEIYHRLALARPTKDVDRRWMSGVEPYLSGALPELGASQRAYLAGRLGLVVDEETRQAADVEDWERLTAPRVQRLLADGKAEDALKLLGSRTERSPASPLTVLEARALGQLQRWTWCAGLLEREIGAAIAGGALERALTLSVTYCEIVQYALVPELLPGALARLAEVEETVSRPQDHLNVLAHGLALERAFGTPRPPDRLEALRAAFDDVPEDALLAAPRLARWAAWSFTAEDTARFSRVLRLVGLPRDDDAGLRTLAVTLATFDSDYSRRLGREPGVLAAEAQVALLDSLTASWGAFLSEASEAAASDAIRGLLDAHGAEVPPSVAGALADVLGSGLLIRLPSDRDAADATLSARGPRRAVPAAVLRDIERALAAAFRGEDELRLLLRYRLDVSLDAIAPAGGGFARVVKEVVAYAAQQGLVPELVAAAREAYPLDEGLLRVTEALGVSTIVPSGALEQLARTDAGLDPRFVKESLAAIEGQVCSVEVGGGSLGTGFLVAADLVLTADHVLGPPAAPGVSPDEVIFRFDYKETADGRVVTPGTVFRMRGIVARCPYAAQPDRLGYALLRVDGAPGGQPIGGSQTESGGALRRWIEVPHWAPDPQPGDALAIVQHPHGEPLKLSYSEQGVIGMSRDGVRLYHKLETAAGSAGSPCFDSSFEPVAFQLGTAGVDVGAPAGSRVAVLLSAVLADLDRRALPGLLGAAFA